METNDLFELYEEVKDDLKFLAVSKVRVKILISLSEGSKKLNKIKEETHLSSSTILHGMASLEKKNLISKGMEGYSLSQIGKITAFKLMNLIKNLFVVKEHERLWLNHEISGIPNDLLKDVGYICNSILVESTTVDVTKPRSIYAQFLKDAKSIKGVTSVIYPYFIGLLRKKLNENVNVQFVINEEILEELINVVGMENLRKSISSNELTLWKANGNLRVVFIVTDKHVFMGLFSNDGVFDLTKILISEDEKAIIWGNRLFNYYRDQAEEIKL